MLDFLNNGICSSMKLFITVRYCYHTINNLFISIMFVLLLNSVLRYFSRLEKSFVVTSRKQQILQQNKT